MAIIMRIVVVQKIVVGMNFEALYDAFPRRFISMKI